MSKCYKIKKLFGSYIYNTISQEEKANVDEHIKTCQKCAEDLITQQKTLEMVKIPQNINYNDLQLDEDRFMSSVYRRIAIESMKQKSQQVTLRKFVYQPAIATATIVLMIAFVVTRFDNTNSPEYELPSVASNAIIELPEIRETKVIMQDEVSPKAVVKVELGKTAKKTVVSMTVRAEKRNETKQSGSVSLLKETKINNSRDWLMNADLINYSLGEPRRALSRYQMIIDLYPDTDAAKEAQKRIKTILDSEFTNRNEEIALETESSDGI